LGFVDQGILDGGGVFYTAIFCQNIIWAMAS